MTDKPLTMYEAASGLRAAWFGFVGGLARSLMLQSWGERADRSAVLAEASRRRARSEALRHVER